MTSKSRCARCGDVQVKSWANLTDDEKEVVSRLRQSAEYTEAERRLNHEWCTRCWHEQTNPVRHA
ncbi:MAG TPA: hypothetical protein VJU86_19650 [Pyrinomonadaceae bacterium]|nr:hypothetical protein [Pyrinomonadaceae bacterium]